MFFIETRIGEPLTAIDIAENIVVFGSISGYYGKLNTLDKKVDFSKTCESELVRDIKIQGESFFVAIGDEKVLQVKIDSMEIQKIIHIEAFKHQQHHCSNMFTWIRFDRGDLKQLLVYFPTLDTEKLKLELVSNDNKNPCYIKNLINKSEEDFSNKFVPKNYSVPMDFDGKRILFIYREMNIIKKKKNPIYQIISYDFNQSEETILNITDKSVKLLKYFHDGVIFVQNNTKIFYYDFQTKQKELLYNQQYTIVILSCDYNLIISIDKQLKLNIFNFSNKSFISNDIFFKSLDEYPQETSKYRFFEMEYPYFSRVNGHLFSFSTDFGLFTIDIQKQFNK